MTVVLTLAFGLILGSIGSAGLAHAQQQANTTATGSNMTGKATTGPGAATNATKSPSSVGGGNMTSPANAKAANETGGGSTAGSGNATQSGNQTMTAAKQQSANQTGNNTGNPLAKIPIIGKIFGGK